MRTPINGVSFILRTIIGFLFTAKPHHEKNWYKICIKFLRLTDRDIIAVLRYAQYIINAVPLRKCCKILRYFKDRITMHTGKRVILHKS